MNEMPNQVGPQRRIDAHHHLWRYDSCEFDWIDAPKAALKRDFLTEDLLPELRQAGVEGTIVVQARQSLAETDWLLSLAGATPEILGVVGWLPIADPGFAAILHGVLSCSLDGRELKGLRHVVQAERAGFLDSRAFNEGMREVTRSKLVYDLLITWEQLEESLRFVDHHPAQQFVIDHIAKPAIASGALEPWAAHMRKFAERSNVSCKISGMATEADWDTWTPASLQPYFDVVLETFGPGRLMVGTDWPVLRLACDYHRWWHTVDGWIAPLSPAEQAEILSRTATRVYGLSMASPGGVQ